MKPDAEASLHIGLGIGMTAKAFAEHGLRTDVIELHPEVGHPPSSIAVDYRYRLRDAPPLASKRPPVPDVCAQTSRTPARMCRSRQRSFSTGRAMALWRRHHRSVTTARQDLILPKTQVPELAAEFFDWKGNGSLATADAGKVVDDLLKLDPQPEYDIIVHDVFSGV